MRWLLVMLAAVAMNVAAEGKVAVVDMERALFLSEAAKTAAAAFEKENKSEIENIQILRDELRSMQEKIEKEADVMSQEEIRKMSAEFEEKKSEFEFFSRKLQQLDQKWKRDFFQQQLPELEELLKTIIDEGGYDVVLQSGAVIYSSSNADLTKLLLDRLNGK